jgi:hypothetical protein
MYECRGRMSLPRIPVTLLCVASFLSVLAWQYDKLPQTVVARIVAPQNVVRSVIVSRAAVLKSVVVPVIIILAVVARVVVLRYIAIRHRGLESVLSTWLHPESSQPASSEGKTRLQRKKDVDGILLRF